MEPDLRALLTRVATEAVPPESQMPPRTIMRARRRRVLVLVSSVLAATMATAGSVAVVQRFQRTIPPSRQGAFTVVPLNNDAKMTVLTTGGGFVWAAGGNTLHRIDGDGSMTDIHPAGKDARITINAVVADRNGTWVAFTDHQCPPPRCGKVAVIPAGETKPSRIADIGRPPRAILRQYDSVIVATPTSTVTVRDDGTTKEFPRRGVSDILALGTAVARMQALVRLDDGTNGTALIQIEPFTGKSESRFDIDGATGMRNAAGTMWVTVVRHGRPELQQIVGSKSVVRRIPLDLDSATKLAYSGASLFVAGTDGGAGEIHAFDLHDGSHTDEMPTASEPEDIAVAFNKLWVLHSQPSRLARMDITDPRAAHPPRPTDSRTGGLVQERPGLLYPSIAPLEKVEVQPDGITLKVHFLGGFYPCSALDHVEVIETATSITVLVIDGHDSIVEPPENSACPSIGILRHTLVKLKAPVGSRTIANDYRPYS